MNYRILETRPDFLKDKQYVVVAGAQFGDEGKGKIELWISQFYGINLRSSGGSGTGATAVIDGYRHRSQLIPPTILLPASSVATVRDGKRYHILTGQLMCDLDVLARESDDLRRRGFPYSENDVLLIDRDCSIVNPWDIMLDRARESEKGRDGIGSTGRGMGPGIEAISRRSDLVTMGGIGYEDLAERLERASIEPTLILNDKISRLNNPKMRTIGYSLSGFAQKIYEDTKKGIDLRYSLRGNSFDFNAIAEHYKNSVKDRLVGRIDDVKEFIIDTKYNGDGILISGNQSALLDIVHGLKPYTTSSRATAMGIAANAGIPRIDLTVNVVKALMTRVGHGPFPTKIKDEEKAKILRERAGEFGTVTGRPRDVGHLDLLSLAYAIGVNGGNDNVIALTKTDVFDGVDIEVAGTYLKGDEVLHRFPRDNTILSECVGYDY
ncbi:adenylosuccinate synthetase [Candidatus Woesearchaeota archaeon]|nr:MAG: adenylosuccinate synthase [archaeon GW2011_AR18]MBS3161324.1 adenylosuccinate synthetase [Candidatus Woesearchaeota archaeon]HIH26279.1 adenylosuccinate synthetase [Nanoarchaeota archaeon]